MSIVIRLQNLPLSAKSGDIRRFFGGLRIPNGGVHIVGGETGDAFIAFMSDEDARIAMKRDGNKIKDSRVKLYLSSSMEMHHEIAKITKKTPDNSPRELSPNVSRNLQRFGERNDDDSKWFKDYPPPRGRTVHRMDARLRSPSPRRRSRSPIRGRSPKRLRSPKRFKSPRRSMSPRALSRSPRRSSRHSDYRNSESPYSRKSLSPRRSVSPRSSFMHSFHSSEHRRDASPFADKFSSQEKYFNEDFSGNSTRNEVSYVSEEQAQLERKIAEALERGYAMDIKENSNDTYQSQALSFFNPALNVPNQVEEHYPNSFLHGQEYSNPPFAEGNIVMNNPPPPFPPFGNNFHPGFGNPAAFPAAAVQSSAMLPPTNPMSILEELMTPIPPPIPPPIPFAHAPPGMPPPPNLQVGEDHLMIRPGFYVTVSGLDPNWNSNDVQLMLRGIFMPQNNIKWEVDDRGLKTGTAFLKLLNEDDYSQLLSNATYVYNSKIITVSECPDHVYQRYFLPDWPPKPNMDGGSSSNMYYRIKGLPFYSTYDSVVAFFEGLEVADMYIEFNKMGKASGLCWVSFKNMQDYQEAMKLDGKQLGHRIVHFKPTNKEDMMKRKRRNGDLFYQSTVLTPYTGSAKTIPEKVPSKLSRPLCAMLTGLPSDITPRKVLHFFKDSGLKPDAVHVTLNDVGRPCGRAFVEFSAFRDFDSALQCHGNTLEKKIICVKQVLYEEMSKILSSKRAMHFYGTAVSANLPDKVPYLWQPPDGGHDGSLKQQSLPQDNYEGHLPDYNPERMNIQVFDYRNQSEMPPTVLMGNLQPPDFLEKEQNYDLPSTHGSNFMMEPFSKGNKNFPSPTLKSGNNNNNNKKGQDIPVLSDRETNSTRKHFNNHRDSTLIKITKDTRALVKFGVKNKQQVAKHTKVDDAFDKNSKNEPKKKLSRLSPEKKPPVPPKSNPVQDATNKGSEKPNPKQIPPAAKDKPDVKEDKAKPQSKTKDQNVEKKGPKQSQPKIEKDVKAKDSKEAAAEPRGSTSEAKERRIVPNASKDRGGYKGKQTRKPPFKQHDRTFNGRDGGYRRNFAVQQRRRSYSRSPIRYDDFRTIEPYPSNEEDYSSYNQAVVQISNVHPAIGSHEIKKFLCGYKIDAEQIIRGYTNTGEPTGDVRVTFRNYREAKMAVKNLDNHLLEGIPVSMFLVS